MQPLEKPIALITGATSGIGQATARRLAQAGFRLIITGRRAERLHALADELRAQGVDVLSIELDVRDAAAVTSQLGNLPDGWVDVEVLVNNAGLARGLAPADQSLLSDWDEMIDTNLKGLLYVTRTLLPGFRSRGRGTIINIGSTAAKEVYPGGNVYSATKHAVDAFTRGLRIDLLGSGVRVCALQPGLVQTEFSLVRFHGDADRAANVYKGYQPLNPEDVAEVLAFMVAAPPHVVLADVVMMCRDQASSLHVNR